VRGAAPPPGELAELAETISHEAGALVAEIVAEAGVRSRLHADAERKTSATDLSTAADRASEQLIAQRLLKARPDDALVAEESASHGGTSSVSWVVDPIDGTTNFVYGYGSYAISIAAMIAGEAVAGVVFDPTRNETFSAWLGHGATLNARPLLHRSSSPPIAECLLGTGFGYLSDTRRRQALLLSAVLPEVRDIRRGGAAALDLCYVAAGRLDAYYESGLAPWDRAAGVLIARETGLVAADLDRPEALAGTLLVAPLELLAALTQLLTEASSRT
jgi:myo-inositol-1(or 4)-monophosphatase